MSTLQKILFTLVIAEALALAGWHVRERAAGERPEVRKEAIDAATVREIVEIERSSRPDQAADWLRLGRIYRAFNLLAPAERCFREADRLAPKGSDHLFDWAATLSRMGRTREARPICERAIAAGIPESGEVQLMLARDRLREEDVGGAEKYLREIASTPEATLMLTRLLVRTGRAQEARTRLDQWLQSAPDDFRARQMRAWVAEALGHEEEARLHRLIGLRCRDWGHRQDLISGRDHGVRQQFARDRILAKVQQLEMESKWNEAAAGLREALAFSWSDDDAGRLATIELHAGRPQQAIIELERLVQAAGASGEHFLSLAQAWLATGDEQKAFHYATQAEQLGANQSAIGNVRVQQFLLSLAGKRNDPDAAKRHQGRIQFELAKQSWSENNVAQAHQQFLRATALEPLHAHAWFYLGETSAILRDMARAKQSYLRCLELQPNHGRARVALERLR